MEEQSNGNRTNNIESRIKNLFTLILKAVACAMGVAVVVLSVMQKIEINSGFTMMGIGLACVGISLLQNTENN